jgi:hypothetical protein
VLLKKEKVKFWQTKAGDLRSNAKSINTLGYIPPTTLL